MSKHRIVCPGLKCSKHCVNFLYATARLVGLINVTTIHVQRGTTRFAVMTLSKLLHTGICSQASHTSHKLRLFIVLASRHRVTRTILSPLARFVINRLNHIKETT